MIEITYKGFIVKVSDVNEAMRLLKSAANESVDVGESSPTETSTRASHKTPKVVKAKKGALYTHWQPDEIKFIIDNIALGKKAVKSSPVLRERHTKKRIAAMIKKVLTNTKYHTTSRENQALIDQFHSSGRAAESTRLMEGNKSALDSKVEKGMSKRWTEEEMSYLFKNIDLGGTALSQIPSLRARHSESAIKFMYYRMQCVDPNKYGKNNGSHSQEILNRLRDKTSSETKPLEFRGSPYKPLDSLNSSSTEAKERHSMSASELLS